MVKKKRQIGRLLPYASEFIERHFTPLVLQDVNRHSISYAATAATVLAIWMQQMLFKRDYLQNWASQATEDDLQLDLKVRLLEFLLEEKTRSSLTEQGFIQNADQYSPLAILQRRKIMQKCKRALQQITAIRKFTLCDKKQPVEYYPALLKVIQ